MGLDLLKLEKVKKRGSSIIARCPACAETGNDRKGEHLFVNNSGQFGCVLYPGVDGQQHRQRIFDLVGIKENSCIYFEIKKPPFSLVTDHKVIQKDILGHLGHIKSTHARKNLEIYQCRNEDNKQEECADTVPSVPTDTTGNI